MDLLPQFQATEPPPTKVEGFSGIERLRRTVGSFPTEVGGFKPDFWKMKKCHIMGKRTSHRSVLGLRVMMLLFQFAMLSLVRLLESR